MKEILEWIGVILLPIAFILLIGFGVYKVWQWWPETVYMTNDEIIRETKKCTDAGLDAMEDGYTAHIQSITCFPKKEQEKVDTQNIKKSNVTNITVEK